MKESLFGTDGIRTEVGTHPLTNTALPQLGHAIGSWLCTQHKNPSILIATDTRESGPWIQSALISGLLQHPITIHNAHILPTPAVCKLVQDDPRYTHGIIITASHNPYTDNGIKIVNKNGKIALEDELFISNLMLQMTEIPPISPVHPDLDTIKSRRSFDEDGRAVSTQSAIAFWRRGKGQSFGTVISDLDASERYKKILLNTYKPNMLTGLNIVLDCAHGALSTIAPDIFRKLGATVYAINADPNGVNINKNCGVLHPEEIQKTVQLTGSDIGFAFDGDGDRITAINKNGELKDGDDILALLSKHPKYHAQSSIIGTIMSNHGLDLYVQEQNMNLIRVGVGDRQIAEALITHNLLLGGEPSGHIIMRDYMNSGDGLYAALLLAQLLVDHKSLRDNGDNQELSTFKHVPQISIKIPIITPMSQRKDLSIEPFATIIREYTEKLNSTNHTKNTPSMGNTANTGRLIIRYSGTEPLLRIMIEHHNAQHAAHVGNELAQALRKQL